MASLCQRRMIMQPRMTNIAMLVPDAFQALMSLGKSAKALGLPARTALLVEFRASQINGCAYCVYMHSKGLTRTGHTDYRLFALPPLPPTPHLSPSHPP